MELFDKDDSCREKVSIQKEIASGICIQMDPIHFRQILWNLLLNAAEAIDGSGSIDINLFSAKGRRACMEISDTGCGISEADMGQVFHPFYTTKEVGEGTGLGLSIAHGIVQEHAGRIEVRSRQGEGTEFEVALPLDRSQSPEEIATP